MRINKISIIARHEFNMVAHTKTFLIITILGPFLIFAITVLPSLLNRNSDGFQEGSVITVVGASSDVINALSEALSPHGVIVTQGSDINSLKKELIENSSIQGIVEISGPITAIDAFNYYSKTGTDYMFSETIKGVIGSLVVSKRLMQVGFDSKEFASLSKTPNVHVTKISKSGEESEQDFFTIMMSAISFIMLLYMSVLLYGQMIGRSIVVEKSSKTIEVLLSSARPEEIMAGKIVGIGRAGLLQYAIWIGAAFIIQSVLSTTSISIPSMFNNDTLLFLLLFFLAAFLLYSSLYAALGAAAENEQNLGQLAWPLIIFLVIPMVMISTLVMNPTSFFSLFLSYFPLTSPMVMFIRVMVNMPPWWELLLCFLILIGSIIVTIWFSAKIFRVGILLTGKKHTIKEIIKWGRYKN